ncbi:MAG TPA: cellulase family glycosylhydrolase [Baekduia sp.]|nr:cellulase family glycosylhydrolase [Baekduia sp.]
MPTPTPLPTRALPRALALALVLAAVALSLTVATGSASAKPLYGVQGIDALPWIKQSTTDKALDQARAVHAKVIRVEALWSLLEPKAPGQRDATALAALDRVVAGASARGMKVLLIVDSTPCWASISPSRGTCSGENPNTPAVTRYQPAGTQGYVDISTFLVARYAKDLAAFEIWNEPDQANEKYWAGPNKIASYVALTKAAYPALKQVAPQVPVLAGSFVGGNGKWLQALYAAGIKGYYDAVSVHFYDLTLSALSTTRAVQRANGDSKPMWLAEFGFTSCYAKGGPAFRIDHACNTRAGQARNLVDTLRSIAKVSWVKAALIYTVYDQSRAYQFGLLTASGARKPAFAAVSAVFAGKKPKVTRPTMKLRARGGRVTVSGTASQVETFKLRVWRSGQLAYRAILRTDRFGAYRLTLPAVIGTSHLRVRLSGAWTGSVTRRR